MIFDLEPVTLALKLFGTCCVQGIGLQSPNLTCTLPLMHLCELLRFRSFDLGPVTLCCHTVRLRPTGIVFSSIISIPFILCLSCPIFPHNSNVINSVLVLSNFRCSMLFILCCPVQPPIPSVSVNYISQGTSCLGVEER